MDWNAFGAEMQAMSQRMQMMTAPPTMNLQISFVSQPQPQPLAPAFILPPAPMQHMSVASIHQQHQQQQPDFAFEMAQQHQQRQTDFARQMTEMAQQMTNFAQQMAHHSQSMIAQSLNQQQQHQPHPSVPSQHTQIQSHQYQHQHQHQHQHQPIHSVRSLSQLQHQAHAQQMVRAMAFNDLPDLPDLQLHHNHHHSDNHHQNQNAMIDLTVDNEASDDEMSEAESEPEEFVPWTDGEVPDEFKCPISLSVMRDPVLCSDGFYYDRECIEDWLASHSRSPMTNLQMDDKRTHRDEVLALKITQWKDAQWQSYHRRERERKEQEADTDDEDEEDEEFEFDEDFEDEFEFNGEYSDEYDEFDEDEDEDEDDEGDEEW